MNSCETLQVELTEALAHGELPQPRKLTAHLRRCDRCRRAWEGLRLTWRALGTLADEDAPAARAQALHSQIVEELASEQTEREETRTGRATLISVVMGVVFAVLSVWIIGRRVDLASFPPQVLLSMGAAWAAIYTGVTLLIVRGGRPFFALPAFDARLVGVAGLGAMALSLLLAGSYSVSDALVYCRVNPTVQELLGGPREETVYFALGGIYSLVPLFLAALFLGARTPRHPLASGLLAGAVFLALALPGVLLECGAFSIGAGLSWIFGAAVGALAGGLTGSLAGASLGQRLGVGRLRAGLKADANNGGTTR